MEKHIYDEKNGLSYTLCGDYYLPDLVLNEEEPTYGKYGMLRKQFLKEHRPITEMPDGIVIEIAFTNTFFTPPFLIQPFFR